MRRTHCALVNFVLDNPSKELRGTARKVEHWRTSRLQASRVTTSPYHKAQYINAFLEAQDAAIMHRHAVEAKSATQSALTSGLKPLTASHELTMLAQELETQYHRTAAAAGSHLMLSHQDGAHPPAKASSSSDAAAVEFGAWRSVDSENTRLRKAIHSVDVMRHCVIREARTPVELSPEVIHRLLPHRPTPAVQRLLSYVQSRSFRAATKPVNADKLQAEVTAALRALRYSHALQKNVALYVVFSLSCYRDWQTASTFVLWLHLQWPSLADLSVTAASTSSSSIEKAAQGETDASHFTALLFETLRWASPLRPSLLPTLDEVEQFCVAFHRVANNVDGAFDGAGADVRKEEQSPAWTPVVAAPLLSVVGLRESTAGAAPFDRVHQVQQLADRFCVYRSVPASYYHPKRQPQALAYMPALAWGEYLRALHRCGASLADLQAATDQLTDANITRHAAQLLSNTHVWNAYLACTPGNHAVEVYENNAKHYRVKETPATVAAVMTALLKDNTTASTREARALWKRLRQGPPARKTTTTTCSTALAYIRLVEAEGDTTGASLTDYLLSYEDLYEGFGVPMEWFDKQRGELRVRVTAGELTMRDGLRVLHRACAAFPFLIPPAVQVALISAVRRAAIHTGHASTKRAEELHEVAERCSMVNADAGTAELTAEDLAAMM